jgi:hypothetical protein
MMGEFFYVWEFREISQRGRWPMINDTKKDCRAWQSLLMCE